MKLICTLGSCLSANVASQISNISSEYHRVSSVQHNRIDQFDNIYIQKKFPPLTTKDIGFELSDEFSYVNTIDNQIFEIGLGRALPKKDDKIPLNNIMNSIEFGKIDLFIFDNFAELLFKLYEHIELKTPMFINEGYLKEKAHLFEFKNSFLSTAALSLHYESTFKFITKKNPLAKIVFIPFPVNLKNNEKLNQRSIEHIETLKKLSDKFTNLFILDHQDITPLDLIKESDIYHFTNECYYQFARKVFNKII